MVLLRDRFATSLRATGMAKQRPSTGPSPKPITITGPAKQIAERTRSSSFRFLYYVGVATALISACLILGPRLIRPVFGSSAAESATCTSDASKTEVVGDRTYYPSFGIFPKGCKWRPMRRANSSGMEYVWWDQALGTWVDERPAICAPTGHAKPGPSTPGWTFHKGTPRSEVDCPDSYHCMYRNLYYNRGRWYALVDGPTVIPTWRFSRNQEIVTIHVEDAWDFVDSVRCESTRVGNDSEAQAASANLPNPLALSQL